MPKPIAGGADETTTIRHLPRQSATPLYLWVDDDAITRDCSSSIVASQESSLLLVNFLN
jgi:hypothetical protein